MIKELMIVVFTVILFFWSIFFSIITSVPSNPCEYPSLKNTIDNIFDYCKHLFSDRNLFGIILSVIVTIGTIPGFILALIISVVIEFCRGCVFIWELGKKKEY